MRYLAFFLFLISSLSYGQNVKTFIPPQAFNYRDIIKSEINKYFPDLYEYNYIPSLGEQESCISMKHSKCWNSSSQLLSKREQGLGIFQTTRAFRDDGSTRFDTLQAMKDKYKTELKESSWSTYKDRPDLQIRSAILMLRDDYKKLYNVPNLEYRTQMTDAAYNGGLGGVLKERRACGLAQNCDPNIWFNNVEKYCLKSKKALYGTRSACDINREHVKTIWEIRLPKYKQQYFSQESINKTKTKPEQIERTDHEKKC